MPTGRRFAVMVAGLLAGASLTAADTLVLRDGRRLEGELVGVRRDVVEFRERGLFGGGTIRQYDRSEVRRIEIEEPEGREAESRRRGDDDREGVREAVERRPSGLREREVNVAASTAWTDTRIDVRSGQAVYFSASGKVHWGPDRRDDPGGEDGSPYNANRPIPRRPAAALIGRVGGGEAFFIGNEEGPIRMPSSGRLHLGVNDDYLPDNSGSFRVTVSY